MATFRFDPQSDMIRLVAHASDALVRRVDLVLDTGASQTVLTPDALRDVGFDLKADGRRSKVTTASRPEEVTLFTLCRLSTLGHSISNLDVVALNLPADLGIDGLLGLNFLRHFKLFINFRRGLLVLQPHDTRSFFVRLTQALEVLQAQW